MRPEWKEWLDMAVLTLGEAREEDRESGWAYSEDQYAMALLEALEKNLKSPQAVRKSLWQIKHLINVTLKHLYAKHRKQLGPRRRGI